MKAVKERKNAYTCGTCGGVVVTRDVAEGCTPMFLSCRATDGCPGRMTSSMYQLSPELYQRPADFEWYAPEPAELATMPKAVQAHIRQFGLWLRKAKESK